MQAAVEIGPGSSGFPVAPSASSDSRRPADGPARAAEAAAGLPRGSRGDRTRPLIGQLRPSGCTVASCAVRHSAAVSCTFSRRTRTRWCSRATGRRWPGRAWPRRRPGRRARRPGLSAQREPIGRDDLLRAGRRELSSSRRANSCACRTMNRSFQSARACSAVRVWLRTGVLRFGSAQSSASMNGFGTLRTMKR